MALFIVGFGGNMKKFYIRLFNLLMGLLLYAIGIVVTLQANIGYAPWEVFHVGFAKTTGLSIGVISIIAGLIIVIIVTLAGEKFGLGSILGMLLTGVFIDVVMYIEIIPLANNMIIGLVYLLIGLFILALGSYFYMNAAFGLGPRDNLMVVLTRKTKLPVGACRGIVEVLATLIGWPLGGMVGIGTIISALAIGPCVQVTFWAFKFDVTAVKHETLEDIYKNYIKKK